MADAVLDASAVLALLNRETGHETVAGLLPRACMSAVNLAEAASVLAKAGETPPRIRAIFQSLFIEIVPFDEDHAFEVGRLQPLTMAKGLSLGDRACLALGAIRALPVWTADRGWTSLPLGLDIRVLR